MSQVVLLGAEQRTALEEALRWEAEALAHLGVVELRRREAEQALARACQYLNEAAASAQQAVEQCRNVVQLICMMLQLPDGEWRYDKSTGQLVMKESTNAQPLQLG